MIGYDKSRYQLPGAGPWGDFEIVQAGRKGDTDPACSSHLIEARARRIPVSLYYRAFPEFAPELQADLLVMVARSEKVSTGVTLWVDIENPDSQTPWPGDAHVYEAAFVARVNGAGWSCGTYSGDNFWTSRGLAGDQGKWKAHYSGTPAQPWDIHQYTSTPLDTNKAEPAAVARLFGGALPSVRKFFEEEERVLS